ncbi:hypothetical protein CYMTET_17243, partial [Cymbomonas tetramitiformis]
MWGRSDCGECNQALTTLRIHIGRSSLHTENPLACGSERPLFNASSTRPVVINCTSSDGEEGTNVGKFIHLVVDAPLPLSFCGIRVYGYLLEDYPSGLLASPIGLTSSQLMGQSANASGNGFAGFGLRRVADDMYLAAAWTARLSLDMFEVWNATKNDMEDTNYTLDYIDYFDGSGSSAPGAVVVGAVSIEGRFSSSESTGMEACTSPLAVNSKLGGRLQHNESLCIYSGGRGLRREWDATDANAWNAHHEYIVNSTANAESSQGSSSAGGNDNMTDAYSWMFYSTGRCNLYWWHDGYLQDVSDVATVEECQGLCNNRALCEFASHSNVTQECLLREVVCGDKTLSYIDDPAYNWTTYQFMIPDGTAHLSEMHRPMGDTKRCENWRCKYASGLEVKVPWMETMSGQHVISSEWEWPPILNEHHRDWGHHYKAVMKTLFLAPFAGVYQFRASAGGGAKLYYSKQDTTDPQGKTLMQWSSVSHSPRGSMQLHKMDGEYCSKDPFASTYCTWEYKRTVNDGGCKCPFKQICASSPDCLPGLECAWNVSEALGMTAGSSVCVPYGLCNASQWASVDGSLQWTPSCPGYAWGSDEHNFQNDGVLPDRSLQHPSLIYLQKGQHLYMELEHLVDRAVGFNEKDPADHISLHMVVDEFPTQLGISDSGLCLRAKSTGDVIFANCSSTDTLQLFLRYRDRSKRARDLPTPPYMSSHTVETLGEYAWVRSNQKPMAARRTCQSMGGALASVVNEEIGTLVSDLLGDRINVYFGLYDIHTEGFWTHENGDRYQRGSSSTKWESGKPDNANNHDCAVMTTDSNGRALWGDAHCNYWSYNFICHLHGSDPPIVTTADTPGGNATYSAGATSPIELAGSNGMCLGVDSAFISGAAVVLKPCSQVLIDAQRIYHMTVPTQAGEPQWKLVLRHTVGSGWWSRNRWRT